jgi:hypothetical protein
MDFIIGIAVFYLGFGVAYKLLNSKFRKSQDGRTFYQQSVFLRKSLDWKLGRIYLHWYAPSFYGTGFRRFHNVRGEPFDKSELGTYIANSFFIQTQYVHSAYIHQIILSTH